MTNINCIKRGNSISISINGNLLKKDFPDAKQADDYFRLALKAKDNPTEENINSLKSYLNEKLRIALMVGLDSFVADPDSGEVFLAGFNTPVPDTLVEVIKEYHEKGFPLKPIVNFWKLLMCNPDTRVRKSLFRFITKHDFVLTDSGYMIVYKAVYRKNEEKVRKSDLFKEFVTNQYLHVCNDWKCSPRKYVVFKNLEKDSKEPYGITKTVTAKNWNERKMKIEFLGNLGDLFNAIVKSDKKGQRKVQYTDMHSRTMTIELGVPATKKRNLCDANPDIDCSNGLHCGATAYVEWYSNTNSIILVCLVNPMNVVAVPEHDARKMRVCEYFPFAVASYDKTDKKITIIEEKYFEDDYKTYETKELNKLVANIKANEKPFEVAQNAVQDERPMDELMKIIENRLVDITDGDKI
ncbi:MAG: hypothetical protein WC333_02170 [Dehalococcoidia bacterium]